MLWVPDSRYWIPHSLLVELGFGIPIVSGKPNYWSWFQSPWLRILHAEISQTLVSWLPYMVTWENSGRLATLPLFFPAKWHLRNERRNSILMTRHYPDLDSASDWLNQISHAARPFSSSIQIWVVTRHQYGISALVFRTSFGGETSASVAKCRPFSQATYTGNLSF